MGEPVRESATAVCAAVRRHAAAVAKGREDQTVMATALVAAIQAYAAAVENEGWEAPDGLEHVDEWLGLVDDVSDDGDTTVHRNRVAVFVRADFAVEDMDLLLKGVSSPSDQAQWATHREIPNAAPQHALAAWFDSRGVFDDEAMNRVGLRLVAEGVQVTAVDALSLEAADYPWGPLMDVQDD